MQSDNLLDGCAVNETQREERKPYAHSLNCEESCNWLSQKYAKQQEDWNITFKVVLIVPDNISDSFGGDTRENRLPNMTACSKVCTIAGRVFVVIGYPLTYMESLPVNY